MKNNTLTITLLIILVVVAIILGLYATRSDTNSVVTEEQQEVEILERVVPEATFTWEFEDADTLNGDGQPETNVYLTTLYLSDEDKRILIDTVDGGCSEIEGEQYRGDISNTGKIQCYYAGFGHQYRITLGKTGFNVERKYFEEALPNVEPTEYKWEVIKTISY